MAGRRWSHDDDAALILAIRAYGPYDYARIADKLGRTEAAVQQRWAKGPKRVRLALQEAARACETARREQDAAEAPKAAESNVERRPDPTDARVLKLEQQLAEAAEENRDNARKLKAVRKEQALFEQIATVVRASAQPLAPISIAKPSPPPTDATPCDMVLILSDEHADEVVSRESTWGVEHSDFGVFCVRLQRLRDLIAEYAKIHLPRHHFERLWILKLGDAVQGDIHEHGPFNHFRDTLKASLAVGDVEAQFVESLLPYFPSGVHVVSVAGNHGRRNVNIKKNYDAPHENWDYLVGTQMATRLANYIAQGSVTMAIPDAWSAFVQVRNTLFCMNHGDDTTGYSGLPWTGFDRRNGRVQTLLARVDRRADVFVYGHYHVPAQFPSAGALSVHSGCWVAAESYALNRLAAGNEPQQQLLVIGDKPGVRGVILPVPIYTRDEKREAEFMAGTYKPLLGRGLVLDLVAPIQSKSGLHIIEAP